MFADYQEQLQSHQTFSSKYRIFKSLNEITDKRFYVLQSQNHNNSQLYILKHHENQAGYTQQKKVFGLSAIYGNYFIESNDELKYTIVKYSQIGSLMELGMRIKIFSFNSAKYYIHTLLSELKTIYQSLNIPFRTLYPTDIIYADDARLMISGFGKFQHQITEKQLIYDCAEILYYMITNSVFPSKAIKKKGEQKNRFLKAQFWDNSKKNGNYMKFMPQNNDQCKKWLNFFSKLTNQSQTQLTLANILGDSFFNQTLSLQISSSEIKYAVLSSKTKEKERENRNFRIKAAADRIKKQQEIKSSQQRSSLQTQYQIFESPFLIPIHKKQYTQQIDHSSLSQVNQRKRCIQFSKQQNNIQSKHHSMQAQQIGKWVYKFFQGKLQQSIDSEVIFQQNWIKLCNYDLSQIELTQKKVIYEFKLYFKYFQQGDISCDPQKEFEKFQIQVFFAQNKSQKERCLKQFYVCKIVNSIHQILFQKLQHYLTQGLLQSFIFSN